MNDLIDRQKILETLDFADKALTDEERTVEKYKELLMECIKVLPSAENDGDLISRQAVENITWEEPSYSDPLNVLTEIREKVRALPSVENKGEWIPVSERLPEIHQDVLLELRSGEMLTGFKAETEPYFYCHGVDGCYVEPQNVLAWQPLPEPYKAERGK